MLKSMRKNMKAVMWILLATFVLWGGSSAIFSSRSKNASYAGIVFAKKVGWKEYDQNYNAVLNQAKLMYGEKFTRIQEYINMEQEAWMRVVLMREAAKKHIGVSDDEVITAICNMSIFHDSSGKFVPEIYGRVVSYFLKVQPREFEEEVKGSLAITKLKDIVIKNVAVSDDELKQAYKEKNEKINADYTLVNANDFKQLISVSDEKVKQFYQAHSQEFRTPAKINIEYLAFEYGKYKTKDEAENAASDVSYEIGRQKQPNLDAAAKKFNLAIKETGYFSMGEQMPGIGQAVAVMQEALKLEPGQITNPIKTDTGRYIIKLKDKKEPRLQTLDEARQDIKDILTEDEATNLARKKANELFTAIKQNVDAGGKFKDTCAELKLTVKSTGDFTRQGQIPDIGRTEDFAKLAFAADAGKLAGVAKVNHGAAIIFVAAKTGIDEEKFKKDKDTFKKTALEEKQAKYFEDWFTKLRLSANVKVAGTPKNKPAAAQNGSAQMPVDDF